MKILILWSSPNQNGLTASAKDSFLAGLKNSTKTELEIEEIHLNRKKINHCIACGDGWGGCLAEGRCILKDDFHEIYEKMIAADGIVLVSAVYWLDTTECMKAFMDRLRRCEAVHNHFLTGKRCVLVACAGGTGLGTLECLEKMELCLKHMGMRAYDRIPVTRYNKDYMLPALEAAGELYPERLPDLFDMRY